MQVDNHIVLRLARDTGSNSADDRWQVLSLSDNKHVRKVRSGKCKKVTRRKQKISVTICKSHNAAKQSNRERGKQKMKVKKNLAKATAVLNTVSILEHGDVKRKDAKQTDVCAADCCDFCVSSNVHKRGTVARRRRTAAVMHKDSYAQKENLFEASNSGNMSKTDDMTNNTEGTASIAADHFEIATNSESLQTKKEDVHKHIDNRQKGSRLNGTFGITGDSKTRRRRKVMPELETKCCCLVKERESEAKDVKNEMEAGELVDVASVSESSTLNDHVVGSGCGILVSRRARPVKNRRLMDSCYVFGQMVKTRRPRKIAKKQQPAAEAVVNAECTITESCETTNDQLQSISDTADHATLADDKLNCHVPESKEVLYTPNNSSVPTTEYKKHDSPSDLYVLCPPNDVSEDERQISVPGNACLPKLNTDSADPDSDTTQILLEEGYMKVEKVEEGDQMVAAGCKYNIPSDVAVDKDVLPAESNSPPLNCINSCVEDFSIDNWQLPSTSENTCYGVDHLGETTDPVVATCSAETLKIEPVVVSAVNDNESCTADNSAAEIQPTDSEMHDVSTSYSDGLSCVPDLNENAANGMDSHMLDVVPSDAEACVFTTATELDCLTVENADGSEVYGDVLNNVMESAAVTVNSAPVEVEEFISGDPVTTESSNDDVLFSRESVNSTQLNEVSDAAVAFSDGIDHGECHNLLRDEMTSNTDSEVVNNSLPQAVVCGSTSESNLSVKRAETSHCHRNNTHRSHRARRKTASESTRTDFGRNLTENPGTLLNVAVCSEEKCEELPAGETSLSSDVVIAADAKSQVRLPHDVSNDTSTESSLTAERTVSGSCRRRNSHRSHRARLKADSEIVSEDVCHGSAEGCTDDTVSSEEKCEPVVITQDLDRLRHKLVDSVEVEGTQGTGIEMDPRVRTRKKHYSECSRLFYCSF